MLFNFEGTRQYLEKAKRAKRLKAKEDSQDMGV